MARQARVQSPTDYYHVIMRGNNRESIFISQSQKEFFKDLLKEQVEDGLIEIASYCIMDNHVHIAIKAELNNVTKAFKRSNIKYAMNFNKEKDRIGHVFQDRYKSEVIVDDKYLIQVIRYIHNNPVKANIVKNPNDFKWSSYNEYIKKDKSGIINSNQREFVLTLNNGVEKFIEFHRLEDDNEYLEIREDMDYYRLEKAQKIISQYFKEKGIYEAKELSIDPILLEEIIIRLLNNTKLSHRKIASLLGISNNVVHLINRDIKKG